MKLTSIKTEVFSLEDSLEEFLQKHIVQLQDRSIICITTKIVSIAEGRVVPQEGIDKSELVKQEADHYLGEISYDCSLTIKNNIMLPAAGIDLSNSETGGYILYPKDPFASARRIRKFIENHFSCDHLGVVLVDSHTSPLRVGVIGVAVAFDGFLPVKSLIGSQDLFGRELKMTQINIVDSIAASANLLMGEGKELSPLVIVEEAPVEFLDEEVASYMQLEYEKDLYYPLYRNRI